MAREQGKVYGIVFLFKYSSPSGENADLASRGTVDHDLAEQIFFAQQVAMSLCIRLMGRYCKMRVEHRRYFRLC